MWGIDFGGHQRGGQTLQRPNIQTLFTPPNSAGYKNDELLATPKLIYIGSRHHLSFVHWHLLHLPTGLSIRRAKEGEERQLSLKFYNTGV